MTGEPLDLSAFLAAPVMRMHRQRRRFLASRKRFDIIAAGRRSGKTVEARHRLLWGSWHLGGNHYGCMTPPPGVSDPTFAYCAPTHQQAKRIVWDKLKSEVPRWAIRKKLENELSITFVTGSKLYVAGMDQPERIEGIPLDGVVPDEFADMKPKAWTSSIRPALSTPGRPPGWALFIGRPRGKNHFWKLCEDARHPDNLATWGIYHPWPSWLVMDPAEIAAARRELDERSFRQEYGGEFLGDAGRAYYQFGSWNHHALEYDPARPLLIAFDFNVSPGVALIAQDFDKVVDVLVCGRCSAPMPGRSGNTCRVCGIFLPHETVTACIDEVWIDDDSNTRRVCLEVISRWGMVHKGKVIAYGDATGGARKTSSERSDWQTIEDYLSRIWPTFEMDLPSVNPNPRDRVVVVNSRLKNASDEVRVYMDQRKVRHLCEDLDQTQLDENGELDEGPERKRTHMCLATGTMVATDVGPVPIEDIRPGDLVWTRRGLRRVLAQWCSGHDAEVYRLRSRDGKELLATATHPVFSGCKWIPTQSLKPGGSLVALASEWSSMASPSIDTRTPKTDACVCTSRQEKPTASEASTGCIERCGSATTEQSRADATSTTSTGTRSTTRSTTLSAPQGQNTFASTASNESPKACITASAKRLGYERPHGTEATKGGGGTSSTVGEHGPIAHQLTCSSARSAPGLSRVTSRPRARTSSAVDRATRGTESSPVSTTSSSNARCAGSAEPRTATPARSLVVDDAVLSCDNAEGLRATVWDLTVEDAHEFFANGILVSNSDALGYLLYQRFGSPVHSSSKGLTFSSM